MKRDYKLVSERRQNILAHLKKNPFEKISVLAELFQTSTLTVRRDLQFLERTNELRFVKGGVSFQLPPIPPKHDQLTLFAKICASYVENRDVIFVSCGEYTPHIINEIKSKHVTVITNIADFITTPIVNENVTMISVGGEFCSQTRCFYGDLALKNLSSIYARKAFISCHGLDEFFGASTYDFSQISILQSIIARTTRQTYLLASQHKIGKQAPFQFANFNNISTIITDDTTQKLSFLQNFDTYVRYTYKDF